MFRREQHRNVLALLTALDSQKLTRCQLLFGGGTRIVLDLDEYRESHDVDFLCSDPEGYAELRFEAAKGGYPYLFDRNVGVDLGFPREMRIDQYGIRFPVVIAGDVIRVELIREARIGLDPGTRLSWSPVDCLSLVDCYAEKLLANSDRWADRQVLSRDLIDLGALRYRIGPVPAEAWRKVEAAYRTAARDDLLKALSGFGQDPSYQRRCFEGLRLDEPERIVEGLALLSRDLGA
ncbi:MAG: nucleotidyl transferase AbiEii/AbiGii toxin family protein [Acidobacteria bacterium]|nr:nucleotidyl transferase AbiEii/AbiGii toxin family protein [Acidobacteriota bacterium]